MTEEHLEEVVAAEVATETATTAEDGEPLIPILKGGLDTVGIDNNHLDAQEMSLVCRCDSGTMSNLVPED